jgi:hypothetical protein
MALAPYLRIFVLNHTSLPSSIYLSIAGVSVLEFEAKIRFNYMTFLIRTIQEFFDAKIIAVIVGYVSIYLCHGYGCGKYG